MGVKGFNKILKRYNVKPITNHMSILHGCKVCVDIEQYFYIYSHRILKNKTEEIKDAWISMIKHSNYSYDVVYKRKFISNYIQKDLVKSIIKRLLRYISSKIYPIVIFDGPIRIDKNETTSSRTISRSSRCMNLFEININGNNANINGNNANINGNDSKIISSAFMKTKSLYYELKRSLTSNNIVWYVAKNDGEELCAKLDRLGYTHGTITTDYDYILFGGTNMIIKLDYMYNGKIIYYNCNDLFNKIAPYNDIVKMCVILGTDFLPKGIKGKGPVFVANSYDNGVLDNYIDKTLMRICNIFTDQSYINEVYSILYLDFKY